ncbi:hypothetical protein Nepgr_031198 [Nepenthes gracilis]|uniref:Uncharacterized protein n=1 Tax=Nepenthes gracilis TaxID=150966 RepID=A0AAD3Y6K7_NEPGR|nr:hypothetical protein Nepgr_031198 [Nepenthes gracilis]
MRTLASTRAFTFIHSWAESDSRLDLPSSLSSRAPLSPLKPSPIENEENKSRGGIYLRKPLEAAAAAPPAAVLSLATARAPHRAGWRAASHGRLRRPRSSLAQRLRSRKAVAWLQQISDPSTLGSVTSWIRVVQLAKERVGFPVTKPCTNLLSHRLEVILSKPAMNHSTPPCTYLELVTDINNQLDLPSVGLGEEENIVCE